MDWMSPLDAVFLQIEDEQPEASLAISSIAVFDGPPPAAAAFRAAVEGQLPLVPRYRQKARELPLDLGPPVWVDDPDFDLDYHLRRTALPAPGDDQQLATLMARIMSQRLDRGRPLWEYWLVEGLSGARWALIAKVHHCMADGVSATDLFRTLMDTGPEPSAPVPDDWRPRSAPTAAALAVRAARHLVQLPWRAARTLADTVRHPLALGHFALDTLAGAGELSKTVLPGRTSSLTGEVSATRRFAFARSSMAEVAAVRRAFGGTFNDVALAAVAAGFRELLISRGERPTPHLIRSLVPVNVRSPGEENILDNRVSLMLAELPVELDDPLQRLAAVQDTLGRLKAQHEAEAGAVMLRAAGYPPFAVLAPVLRLALRLPQRTITTVTTNVPGPRRPLYLLGRRCREIIPYVPIAIRLRVGVSMITYAGNLTFGVTGDYDTAADVWTLARGIEAGMAELVEAASAYQASCQLTSEAGRAWMNHDEPDNGGSVRSDRARHR